MRGILSIIKDHHGNDKNAWLKLMHTNAATEIGWTWWDSSADERDVTLHIAFSHLAILLNKHAEPVAPPQDKTPDAWSLTSEEPRVAHYSITL